VGRVRRGEDELAGRKVVNSRRVGEKRAEEGSTFYGGRS